MSNMGEIKGGDIMAKKVLKEVKKKKKKVEKKKKGKK